MLLIRSVCLFVNRTVTFPEALLTAIQVTVTAAGFPVPPRLPHSLLDTSSPSLLEAEVQRPVTLPFLQSCHMVLIPQSCPPLCNRVDWSPPGSSVYGTLQARILEWVAISFSRATFQPRDRTCVSCLAGGFFTIESPGKPRRVRHQGTNTFDATAELCVFGHAVTGPALLRAYVYQVPD